VSRALAILCFAVSAFFVFYTVRLFVVTDALSHTRAGGHGAYVGAIVFPILAVAFAWLGKRLWTRGRSGVPTGDAPRGSPPR
jgi:membrane protein implicated in regulation of membrane protease activity